MQEDRYYVQQYGPGNFLVRELQRPGDRPSIMDLTIRRFTNREDAHHYQEVMNEQQCQLDEVHGKWATHAMTPEITGERYSWIF